MLSAMVPLLSSMVGLNSLSYEKFSAGNKERGGKSFVGFAASAEILFLQNAEILFLSRDET